MKCIKTSQTVGFTCICSQKRTVRTVGGNLRIQKDKVTEALKRALETQLELKYKSVPNHQIAPQGQKRKRQE